MIIIIKNSLRKSDLVISAADQKNRIINIHSYNFRQRMMLDIKKKSITN